MTRSSPRWGEVWWSELPGLGRRPVVVMSRDAAIAARRLAIVAPCTTTIRGLASEVELDPGRDPVPRRCVAGLDAMESVPVAFLVHRVGVLSSERMREMCTALRVAVDCG